MSDELYPPKPTPSAPVAHVHRESGSQTEHVLDFLAFVAISRPLSVLLDEAPKKIAACVDAEVASLYLLEGDGRSMVMRGNIGFPRAARGQVRLRVGEGITGLAVQTQYPVSVASASEHSNFRSVPELGEEQFPSFLAVPILGALGPLGALVVQRRGERPFSEPEVGLVAALTAPISAAIRLARLLDSEREERPSQTGSGTRKVTLAGSPLVAGKALGAIAALRRPASTPGRDASSEDKVNLEQAMESARSALSLLASESRGESFAFLDSYRLMLDDQRLLGRTFELLDEGKSLHASLGTISREATRAASERADEFLRKRARDVEQLCDALLMLAAPDARASLPNKCIIVAESLSIYDVLVSFHSDPRGFVLTQKSPDSRTRLFLQLLQVPAIADVQQALRWLGPGDISLLDADHGLLIVHPSRSDIAAYRAERKALNGRASVSP
jgi:phosphotransferase system, enzyme I, PtsP